MKPFVKTTGATGVHVTVAVERGPKQKQVWTWAKRAAVKLAKEHPKLLTSAYKIAERPRGTVLVDYNQNAWGRTLASVYSVRPRPKAPVSTPVTWEEVSDGFEVTDFRMDNVPDRVKKLGISGSRCSRGEGGSIWEHSCESPAQVSVPADGGRVGGPAAGG